VLSHLFLGFEGEYELNQVMARGLQLERHMAF
jgi:hypothetical protein